jgi:hypothetical protein
MTFHVRLDRDRAFAERCRLLAKRHSEGGVEQANRPEQRDRNEARAVAYISAAE